MKFATKSLLMVAILVLAGSTAMADYGDPWLPDWSGDTGYTSQYWGLHGVGVNGDEEPAQPLTADNYATNSYGSATAVWVTDPDGYVAWGASAMGSHPAWVEGVYGGMCQMGSTPPYGVTMTIPTGSDAGSLKVFVQFDWYNYPGASVTPDVSGATDVTPAGYYDYELGQGSSGPWYRTTKVFEFSDNPGSITVWLGLNGFAPMIDSFSVTTAVDAAVPSDMPVPEPATMALLGIGGLGVLLRRRRKA